MRPAVASNSSAQRRVESQEDESDVPVVTPCASTFPAECLAHDARVRKTSDTVELKGSCLLEAKHDPERGRQRTRNNFQVAELLLRDLVPPTAPVDRKCPQPLFLF